jgi:hypothetical protein
MAASLKQQGIKVLLVWMPSYSKIIGNKDIDQLAKQGIREPMCSVSFTSKAWLLKEART